MKKRVSIIALCAVGQSMASDLPKTDILLVELQQKKIMSVKNITPRAGYDNQPFFLPDNSGLFYTAEITDNKTVQTDSIFYDFETQELRNITNSIESEYSPTLMPSGNSLSAIVEADGKQLLWQFPLDKKQTPSLIFNNIEPVGYHAWGAEEDLVMFVLGEPHTLQYTKVGSDKTKVVAKNIGRTLRYKNKENVYSFSQTDQEGHWLVEYSAKNEKINRKFQFPQGVEYYTWREDNQLIFAKNNQLFMWEQGETAKKWLDLTPYCSTKISRLNFNAQYTKLAVVCDEK